MPSDIGTAKMSEKSHERAALRSHRQLALARWEGEGGAGPVRPEEGSQVEKTQCDGDSSVEMDVARLHARVVALENLIIALLADAPPRQLDLIREMAAFISPRIGATRHPITLQAASHMTSLVDRADHFRDVKHEEENEAISNTQSPARHPINQPANPEAP